MPCGVSSVNIATYFSATHSICGRKDFRRILERELKVESQQKERKCVCEREEGERREKEKQRERLGKWHVLRI